VGGQALLSSAFTATCDFSHNVVNGISNDPLITVSVTAAMPTYFMQIFGVTSENVSATATAEAYSPNNGTACFSCIKPFFLPNCDYASGHTSPKNNSCPQDTNQKGNGANGFAGYRAAEPFGHLSYWIPWGVVAASYGIRPEQIFRGRVQRDTRCGRKLQRIPKQAPIRAERRTVHNGVLRLREQTLRPRR
jgi:hypothetical protein